MTGLEMDVGGEFDGAVGTTVGNSHGVFVACVVVLAAHELVHAFHADALHLVGGALGGGFGFFGAGDDFGEDAAEDVFTFGVWGVGGGGDGID